jgi:hypothetical protein
MSIVYVDQIPLESESLRELGYMRPLVELRRRATHSPQLLKVLKQASF